MFRLPLSRGGMTPTFRLEYARTRGSNIAGQGWAFALPCIEQRGLDGFMPAYDPATTHYELSGTSLAESARRRHVTS